MGAWEQNPSWSLRTRRARTIARANVSKYRPGVAFVPVTPAECNSVSSISCDVELAGGGVLVAVDISGLESLGCYETQILIESIPASGLRLPFGRRVPPDRLGAVGDLAVDVDFFEEAVGGGGVEEKRDSGGGEKERV